MRPSPRHEGASTWRIGVGVRGRREARGAGVLTERSAAERASTRRPEESLSAWDRERPRTRGRPAPQRRSALRGDTGRVKVPRRLRRARFEPGFKDPSPKGSEADRGLGSEPATGAEPASATEWPRSHIYIYIPITHTSVLPPLTPSGGKDASVCARAGARDSNFRGPLQAQTGDIVHGIGVLKLDIHHTGFGNSMQAYELILVRGPDTRKLRWRHARVKDDHVTCHTL